MEETFLTFKVTNLTDYCEFIDPFKSQKISNPLKGIKVGKQYKVIDSARDPSSKFYSKYIPYWKSAPIIKDDLGRSIMLYYELDNNDPWARGDRGETYFIYDDDGSHLEIEMHPIESKWLNITYKDLKEIRHEKINAILDIEEEIKEMTIEDIFNGDFCAFEE